MKAQELRIGNYVYGINRQGEIYLPDYQPQPQQVLRIGLFNTEVLPINQNPALIENWFKMANRDLSPIPLTEEWFNKFQLKIERPFSEKEFYEIILNNNYMFSLIYQADPDEDKYGEYILHYNAHEYETDVSIKYVHQLQNLHFALTGVELELQK